MDMKTAIAKLIKRQNLTAEEMTAVMRIIMSEQATSAQIAGFLVGLATKGETVEEIASAVKLLRQLAIPVLVDTNHLIDIVGTGGDQSHTFNISTTSAFVVAAAGAKVAKHNNRAISSQSGSADVLEFAGINPILSAETIAQCIEKIGIGFMFAPQHHKSWAHAMTTRRELGVRTLFNILGPLVNPANVKRQLLGVYAKKWVLPLAEVCKDLNSKHIIVMHSEDGLDEISIAAPTYVAELKNNSISDYMLDPRDFGIHLSSLDAIRVLNVAKSFAIMQQVFNNEPGAARDVVALNAGTAIYIAGLAPNIGEGIKQAFAVIASGKAKQKFEELKNFTQHLAITK